MATPLLYRVTAGRHHVPVLNEHTGKIMIECQIPHGFRGWLDANTELESKYLFAEAENAPVSELGVKRRDATWFLNSPDGEAFAADMVCCHFDGADGDIETTLRQVIAEWRKQPDDYRFYTLFGRRCQKPYWSALRHMADGNTVL